MASKHLPRRTKTESGLENELQIQGEGRKSQKPLPPVVGMKSYGKCQIIHALLKLFNASPVFCI